MCVCVCVNASHAHTFRYTQTYTVAHSLFQGPRYADERLTFVQTLTYIHTYTHADIQKSTTMSYPVLEGLQSRYKQQTSVGAHALQQWPQLVHFLLVLLLWIAIRSLARCTADMTLQTMLDVAIEAFSWRVVSVRTHEFVSALTNCVRLTQWKPFVIMLAISVAVVAVTVAVVAVTVAVVAVAVATVSCASILGFLHVAGSHGL